MPNQPSTAARALKLMEARNCDIVHAGVLSSGGASRVMGGGHVWSTTEKKLEAFCHAFGQGKKAVAVVKGPAAVLARALLVLEEAGCEFGFEMEENDVRC